MDKPAQELWSESAKIAIHSTTGVGCILLRYNIK
jgi:hypothetical protein